MGFRFQKRINILPGITLNLGKNGSSFSIGPRGAKVTVGKNGIRKTIGLPGTGLSYSTYTRYNNTENEEQTHSNIVSSQKTYASNTCLPTIKISFLRRLFLSKEDKIFIDGINSFILGNYRQAVELMQEIPQISDASFIAGIISLSNNDMNTACSFLAQSLMNPLAIGTMFSRYGINIQVSFPITDIYSVCLQPSFFAAKLAQAEAFQHCEQNIEACNVLLDLYKQNHSRPINL